MIAVLAGGRMGNQMFQLAFAHAASRRLGTRYDYVEPRNRAELGPPLWQTFELDPWRRRSIRLRRHLELRLSGARELVDVQQDDEPGTVLERLRDGVTYRGYFQSERWFAGYEDDIRRLYTVRDEHWLAFRRRYALVRPYVCIHVRRTDYIDTQVLALPTSYFHDALACVEGLERYALVVVTDDPDAVKRELRDIPGMICERRPAAVDLLLLMHASVAILSNSSFSWWGAWLNQRPGLEVIAPRYWLGFVRGVEEPARVIPPRWTTIPVRDPPLLAAPG